MSSKAEVILSPGYTQKHINFKKRLRDGVFGSPPARLAVRKLMPLAIETMTSMMHYDEKNEESIDALGEYLEQGYNLMIVSNHQSQADVGPLVEVANKVRGAHPEYIKEFDFWISETMGNGKQGRVVEVFYNEGVYPWWEKQGIHPLEVISDNDIESGRVESKKGGGAIAGLRSIRKPNSAVIVCMAGHTVEGKIDPLSLTGERNGMTEAAHSFNKFLEICRGFNEKIIFLPVGINGTYEVFDPEKKNFAPAGLELLTQGVAFKLGQIDMKEEIGSIRLSKPIVSDNLYKYNDPGHELGRRISLEVPPYMRGVFR